MDIPPCSKGKKILQQENQIATCTELRQKNSGFSVHNKGSTDH